MKLLRCTGRFPFCWKARDLFIYTSTYTHAGVSFISILLLCSYSASLIPPEFEPNISCINSVHWVPLMKDWQHKQQPWTWVSGRGMWNKRQWVFSVCLLLTERWASSVKKCQATVRASGTARARASRMWNPITCGTPCFWEDSGSYWTPVGEQDEWTWSTRVSSKGLKRKPKSDSAAFTVQWWRSYRLNVFDPD